MGKNEILKKLTTVIFAAIIALMGMGTSSFAATLDQALTVKNVEAGASVVGYKIVKEGNGQWEKADASLAIADAGNPTASELFAIAADAGKLAKLKRVTFTESGGDYVANGPEAGIYLVLVTPKTGSTGVYTPMIVSADYDQDPAKEQESSRLDVLGDRQLKIGTTTYAKRSDPKVNKELYGKEENPQVAGDNTKAGDTHQIGDVIGFKINTSIPLYTSDYTNPRFEISDTLSEGLKLKQDSIKVYNGDPVEANLIASGAYTIEGKTDSGFTVNFSKSYLLSDVNKSNINVTYEAELTETAKSGFQPSVNTAEIRYSTSPSTTDGGDSAQTKHYTFDIDGDVAASNLIINEQEEIVKTGIDEDGADVTKLITLTDSSTSDGLKEGAKFRLYKKDASCNTAADYKAKEAELLVRRGLGKDDAVGDEAETKADGKIRFRGIDAGEYVLVETQAPTGYARNETPVPVMVTASLDPNGYLLSYSVTINGVEAGKYVAEYQNEEITTVSATYNPLQFNNYRLGTLPSTGGMGTYLFYAIGAAMLILALVLLVKKNRKA